MSLSYKYKICEAEKKSEDYSKINPLHKQKRKINLEDLDCIAKIDAKLDGKLITMTWKYNGKKVCTVMFNTVPASDGYKYFGSLEVLKPYRGHDLSNQILNLITKKYKAGALAVKKDNEVAIRLYKKHGFIIEDSNNRDDSYYYMYLPKNKFLDNKK